MEGEGGGELRDVQPENISYCNGCALTVNGFNNLEEFLNLVSC